MPDVAQQKIGIMGGTFDPIHFGHLRAAQEAKEALGLSEVLFIPSGNPPHKAESKISSAEDRYEMTLLATRDCPCFSVSRIEIENKGYSYTMETLRKLKALPRYASSELYFITGLDAVLDIMSWKQPEEIIKLCKFVAVSRFGYLSSRLKDLPKQLRDSIISIEIPLLAISSTELRKRVATGKSISYLLPKEVEEYIKEKELYVAI